MNRDKFWDEAVRVVRGDPHGLAPLRVDLAHRWSEGHRGYHDLRHLDEVLDALAVLRPGVLETDNDWAVTVLAAWFHDAVYDIDTASDNERLSAALARNTLSQNRIATSIVDDVVALVEATVDHETTQTVGPEAAFHDADLWILSAPTARFEEYCAQVRSEYSSVSDADYARGRAAILGPFLDRPAIYRTSLARREWEAPARVNLQRELRRLNA